MAVSNDKELQEWLESQTQEVCVAIAYRAVMRVLPFATDLKRFDGAERLALLTFRASITSGVASVRPTPDVSSAASAAYAAGAAVAARGAPFVDSVYAAVTDSAYTASTGFDAKNAEIVAHVAGSAAYAAGAAARAADPAHENAGIHEATAEAAANNSAYADTGLDAADLLTAPIDRPAPLAAAVAPFVQAPDNALNFGGPWTFWANWYARAMAGDPLPWDLQEKIALIPNDIWEAGPEAVADEIARIEDDYWAQALPQAETLVAVDDGRFDVRRDPTPDDQRIDKMVGQVQFALDLALRTNSGFNEMCVAFKYLRHTLDNCRDDPNAIEQQFRQARDILKRKLGGGEYSPDDTLSALVDGLDQHALQLRGSHPKVRAAYEIRVQQKLREVDDATMKLVAGGMRAFQKERTAGRLYEDTGLDAETVEQDSGVEAHATAIQRTGGRAAQANLMERASQAAKDVDASGGYKAARIGTTGWTLVDILKSVFFG